MKLYFFTFYTHMQAISLLSAGRALSRRYRIVVRTALAIAFGLCVFAGTQSLQAFADGACYQTIQVPTCTQYGWNTPPTTQICMQTSYTTQTVAISCPSTVNYTSSSACYQTISVPVCSQYSWVTSPSGYLQQQCTQTSYTTQNQAIECPGQPVTPQQVVYPQQQVVYPQQQVVYPIYPFHHFEFWRWHHFTPPVYYPATNYYPPAVNY